MSGFFSSFIGGFMGAFIAMVLLALMFEGGNNDE